MRPALLLAALLLPLAGCLAPSPPTYADDPAAGSPSPAPSTPSAPSSPYVGQEGREIKALSPEEVAGYRSGAGLGFAKPAELNSYPGPLHALQLAEELQLAAEQRAEMERIREDMLTVAVPLGERFLGVEAEIEQRFRDGTMDEATLERLLGESADIEAALRYAHLQAHLETKALMTRHQVALYDELRGYGEADHAGHEHSM